MCWIPSAATNQLGVRSLPSGWSLWNRGNQVRAVDNWKILFGLRDDVSSVSRGSEVSTEPSKASALLVCNSVVPILSIF